MLPQPHTVGALRSVSHGVAPAGKRTAESGGKEVPLSTFCHTKYFKNQAGLPGKSRFKPHILELQPMS